MKRARIEQIRYFECTLLNPNNDNSFIHKTATNAILLSSWFQFLKQKLIAKVNDTISFVQIRIHASQKNH